jgi:hypothetical protein
MFTCVIGTLTETAISIQHKCQCNFETKLYCNMHACLRPLLSNGPSQQVNSGDAC